MATYGRGVISAIAFHASLTLGGTEHDLGVFESEKDAQNAIDLAEAEWQRDLADAVAPPKTTKCHDCDGSGQFNGEQCNICAGTGWVSV